MDGHVQAASQQIYVLFPAARMYQLAQVKWPVCAMGTNNPYKVQTDATETCPAETHK